MESTDLDVLGIGGGAGGGCAAASARQGGMPARLAEGVNLTLRPSQRTA